MGAVASASTAPDAEKENHSDEFYHFPNPHGSFYPDAYSKSQQSPKLDENEAKKAEDEEKNGDMGSSGSGAANPADNPDLGDTYYHFPFPHGNFYPDAYAKSSSAYPTPRVEPEVEESYYSSTSTDLESESESEERDPLIMYARKYPELNRIDTVQEDGDNALLIAIRAGHHDATIWLLDHGMPLEYQNTVSGDTGVHIAVKNQDKELVQILKQYNPYIANTIRNKKGLTALKIAKMQHDIDMQILLAEDVDAKASVLKKRRRRDRNTPKMRGMAASNTDRSEMGASFALYASGGTERTEKTDRSSRRGSVSSQRSNRSNSRSIPAFSGSKSNTDSRGGSRSNKKKMKERKKKYKQMVNHEIDLHIDNASNSVLKKYLRTLYKNEYATFEEKEDASEKLQIEMNRDAANRTDEWRIGAATVKLPVLKSWLFEKKGRSWKRRYVVVSGSQILWGQDSRNQNLGDPLKRTVVKLNTLGEVEKILEGKTGKKFMFMQDDGKREKRFDWKCQTKEDRDRWVKGLKKHQEHYERVIDYLDQY